MATRSEQLVERLQKAMPDVGEVESDLDEITLTVSADKLLDVCLKLRDLPDTGFVQMVDLCGVDYATYGSAEWSTDTEAGQGFSRAVDANSVGRLSFGADADLPERELPRFAVVYHLLSLDHNCRLRVRCYCPDNDFPVVPSVVEIWSCADWYEREAFDMYGILFRECWYPVSYVRTIATPVLTFLQKKTPTAKLTRPRQDRVMEMKGLKNNNDTIMSLRNC